MESAVSYDDPYEMQPYRHQKPSRLQQHLRLLLHPLQLQHPRLLDYYRRAELANRVLQSTERVQERISNRFWLIKCMRRSQTFLRA
jgi:hypothetical protein